MGKVVALKMVGVGIRVRRVLPMATWEGVWPWAKQADSEGVSLASKAIQPQAEEYHRAGLKGGEDLTYNRERFQLNPAQLGQLLPCLPATTAARCVHSLSQYQGRGDEWFSTL